MKRPRRKSGLIERLNDDLAEARSTIWNMTNEALRQQEDNAALKAALDRERQAAKILADDNARQRATILAMTDKAMRDTARIEALEAAVPCRGDVVA